MIALSAEAAQAALVFCRVSGCLMVLPFIAGAHLPMRLRILLALALGAAMTPLGAGSARAPSGFDLALAVLGEFALGLALGLVVRLLFMAFESAFNFTANAIGLTITFGSPLEAGEQLPALTGLFNISLLMMFLGADLHHTVIGMLAESFDAAEAGAGALRAVHAEAIMAVWPSAFGAALSLAAPAMIWALVANAAAALVNRAAPHLAVFFLAAPVVIAGGVWLTLSGLAFWGVAALGVVGDHLKMVR